MRTSPTTHTHQHHAPPPGIVARTFRADFACVSCAEAAERALRAHPHVTDAHTDYPARAVSVTYHTGMVDPRELQAVISESAHGCRCTVEGEAAGPVGGDLP